MDRLVIVGGRVVDPSQKLDRQVSLTVENDRIAGLGDPPQNGDVIIDAAGMLVFPGLIDMHVHLREPGDVEAEDVHSGTLAAAAGGFTTVVCMPNTKPVMDRQEHLETLLAAIEKHAVVRVVPAAAISLGLEGKQIASIEALAKMGIRVISDDGVGTGNFSLLQEALHTAALLGIAVLTHCEDHTLRGKGVMHAGESAKRLGIAGISSESEFRAIQTAIDCNVDARAKLHIQHVSTKEGVEAVRSAKIAGLPVSAEVTPHHLYLSENDVEASLRGLEPDPNFKMNPPLRSERDRRSLLQGLVDGVLDVIASDHAPHTRKSKRKGFVLAPFGVTGLETALALVLRLVEEGRLDLCRALSMLTVAPATILGLEAGTLCPGKKADITIVDPGKRWKVTPSKMRSRSKNSPFLDWMLRGKVMYTIVGGKTVYRA